MSPLPRFAARWDLDKTYLRTEFDTVRDLVRTAVERPDRKRSVPGAAALLREIGKTGARIHILSGSPRQMRGRLVEKLGIDRVRFDELTLKPNLSNALKLRFRAMRDQLGYKLPALLEARVHDQSLETAGGTLAEVLVGDDAEADAFVYSLYADILSGKVEHKLLEKVLERGRIYPDQAERALAAAKAIEPSSAPSRILIHLDRQTPPSRFLEYGGRVVPFFNYFQAAIVLMQDGQLGPEAVLRVASELAEQHRFDAEALSRSLSELVRRGHVRRFPLEPLNEALNELTGRLPTRAELGRMLELIRVAPIGAETPLIEVPDLDYVLCAERHRGGRNRRQLPR